MTEDRRQLIDLSIWFKTNRLPQAMLWEIPRHVNFTADLQLLQQHFFCSQEGQNACNQCSDCHWVLSGNHPDSLNIVPDQVDGPIKIEAIRELQNQNALTSFRGRGRLVILHPAECMNLNAANALLKILEEPTLSTHFILITHEMHSIPMTIKSRCVKYSFLGSNISTIALQDNISIMMEAWCDALEMKCSICGLIKTWLEDPFVDVVHALYVCVSEAIKCTLRAKIATITEARFIGLVEIDNLFQIIDKLNAIIKKVSQKVSMNEILVLEDLLITPLLLAECSLGEMDVNH